MTPEVSQIWYDEIGYRITITQIPYWIEGRIMHSNNWVVFQSSKYKYPLYHLMQRDDFCETHRFYAHNKSHYLKNKLKEFWCRFDEWWCK